ncbi:MAG TPA: NADH-quinone oxidoreductase subunit NuoG [Paracoccaceae bacterium]|nr:NADH-quinone oxidoreductase subunit NuoG [Paracoccaceae bacterium]
MSELRKILIDGKEIEADPGLTLIQACEIAGVEIPRFCYHERLSIAGNCRMCLVEIVGGPPKPAASCHMQVRDLRPGKDGAPPEVRTDSPMVKKAREGVMEFLLINHPLDCPICDQGGECDLQDQAIAYGVDFSRFREPKRSVVDLNLGPLVETHMTRCIHCTRCIRFMTEVAGVAEMGATGRGEDMRIVTFGNEMLIAEEDDAVTAALRASLSSEMQGNIVDLCPVGALTNKPYAFTARPWELRKNESIDVMDALGSNIRIDCRGREVMRILPRNHDGVNEEWLADRSRYHWDGLRRQRLDRPYVRIDGKLRPVDWPEAFKAVTGALRDAGSDIAAVAGDLAPVEAMWALKDLMGRLGSDRVECRQDGAKLPVANRSAYVGTAKVEDLDTARAVLIIGANPRLEAPVLNARIRKAWVQGGEVALIGEAADLTYTVHHMGDRPGLLTGDNREKAIGFMKERGEAVVIVGQAALTRPDGAAILGHAMSLAEAAGAKLMVLHTAAARVGGMDIGFAHADGLGCLEGAKVIYNLGADEIDIDPGPFVIYHGSHGDRGAHRADVILPGAAYSEQSGIFVNLEGRPQMAFRSSFPPGDAREDWAILRALSGELGLTQPWDSLGALRQAMLKAHPHFGALNQLPMNEWRPVEPGEIEDLSVRSLPTDHWLANPILRASQLMAEMSQRTAARATALAAE